MPDLTPQAFAEKWGKSKLSERSAYRRHLADLCGMLGQSAPAGADPEGPSRLLSGFFGGGLR